MPNYHRAQYPHQPDEGVKEEEAILEAAHRILVEREKRQKVAAATHVPSRNSSEAHSRLPHSGTNSDSLPLPNLYDRATRFKSRNPFTPHTVREDPPSVRSPASPTLS